MTKLAFFLILAAVVDLSCREAGYTASVRGFAIFTAGVLALCGWAWLQARAHFCNWRHALVRLETVLGLHSRLSAAADGVVPWPEPHPRPIDGYVSNWRPMLLPLLAGVLLFAGATLVPVHQNKAIASSSPISEPPELAQVQKWINALKADSLVQADKLQEMQEALDKLQDRPAQDWYTQGNLEAASSLKELAERSMNSLSQNLDNADQSVQGMQAKLGDSAGASALQPLQDQLRAGEQNLASGNLPLNHELLSQLKEVSAASDMQLTSAQLAALHNRLSKGEGTLRTALRGGGAFSAEMKKAMAEVEGMEGGGLERHEISIDGRGGPHSGGLGGGTETAPLELEQRDQTTPEGKLTPMQNDDMSHVSIGQTIKITASAPSTKPGAYQGLQQAGPAQVQGNGGDAVWRSTYDPQEVDTLDRFFK